MIPIVAPNDIKYYSNPADAFTKRASYYMDDKNELYKELDDKNKTILILTSLLQKVRFIFFLL